MKTPEQEAVLRSIRKLVDFWQISPQELMPEEGDPPIRIAREAPVLAPKYRHPVSGETWDGEGHQPPWLKEALTRQGYTVDELRWRDDTPQQGADGPGVMVPPTGIEPVSGA